MRNGTQPADASMKPNFNRGKLLRNLVGDDVAEGHQRLNSAMAESVVPLDIEQREESGQPAPV